MAETRVDMRERGRHGQERGPCSSAGEGSFAPRVGAMPSFRASTMAPDSMSLSKREHNEAQSGGDRLSGNRGGHGHSFSFGGGAEELTGEPIAVFLLRGGPGCGGGPPALPGVRDSRPPIREPEGNPAQVDSWNDSLPEKFSGERSSAAYRLPSQELSGSWSSLGHRRVHSAPNIMAGIEGTPAGSRWQDEGLPWLSSDVLSRNIRDHAIPEGRRFEALEPPLQPDISPAPGRPRSWRVRTQPPPWGAGPSVKDFAARDPSNLEWVPKLRASYFVDVRSQEGETTTAVSGVHGAGKTLVSQPPAIGSMAANTRPFEEIKRMRLSQALDKTPKDAMYLGLTPSPTYSTSTRSNLDHSRLAPRFSPGKGVKMGFTATLKGRSAFSSSGIRDGGFGWQPLSPALTEPPTPPARMDWKTIHEPDAPAPPPATDREEGHAGSMESEQDVLPMEQRPLDEVNAVQALMSVGRGTRSKPDQASDVHLTIVEEPAGHVVEPPHTPMPSLDRLKPFDGVDDDDDGLDKDLWVVVEKGSLCAAADCVYRDAAARIASRRHYHSKCSHTHNGGVKKGMVFHHHQLEKVQKHQRSHKREATKSAPYKRMTPEDHQAMEGAGVEGYRPDDWDPEETRHLDELVNQLVAPVTHAWPSIARFFPTKSSIQCLLHWRFTLNDNGIIRGNGTWGAEEDERLRKLAPVFSSPATGPRWAKIAEVMPGRTAKQCRERYNNHVDPGIKKDKIWTAEEDSLVMQLHAEHHNQFAKIARRIPGRCYDDVKNRFNLLVKRRQLAGKPANCGLPSPGSTNGARPSLERAVTVERPACLSPDTGTFSAGAGRGFSTSDSVAQAALTCTTGVKRSTTEMSVD